MDLRLLTTFRTIADRGSVSAAAAALRISQPALSRQLQQLERELGVVLFLRHKRRLELTAAGRAFLDAARDVLTAAEAARSLGAALAAGRLATVLMAAPTTTITDVLAPFLAGLRPEDPLITVEEADYATAARRLRTGVDLAVLAAPPPRGFDRKQVAVLPIWAYVNEAHPWSARGQISITELAEQRLIVLDASARPRRLLDEALIQGGLAPRGLVECGNPQVAQALAAAGRGVAVLSDDARYDLRPLQILIGHGRRLTLTLHAGWDPAHHAADELERLAARLSDFCLARYGAVTSNPPDGAALSS